MFSSRIASDLTPNRLSAAIARLRAAGLAFDDLTESNPTRVGIEYPGRLLDALAHPSGLTYAPEPFGLPSARDAVVSDFRRRGMRVSRDRVVLTASTSDAYSMLFKLLCDPGDEVLVPAPSYPLFEYLAALDSVRPRTYALDGSRGLVDRHRRPAARDDRPHARRGRREPEQPDRLVPQARRTGRPRGSTAAPTTLRSSVTKCSPST